MFKFTEETIDLVLTLILSANWHVFIALAKHNTPESR